MESRPYNKPALIRTPSFASTVLKIYIKHHNLLLAALFFWAIDADPRSREDRIVFLTEYMNPIFLEIEESVCFSNAPYADAWVLMTRRYISESTIRYREEMDEAAWQDFVEQIDILWGFVPKKADRIRLLSGAAEHKKLCER
ncbi:hypothetical protein SISSUDRAFT_1040666 [Sistotremastrum suecicum HHB10207 ss-3]|uniref:Uncharacterized protein n=1 Tax=Sistotremastrum suecicum HHB10207 ss-3 TaxID=1314776 RepID=A0A166HYP7_9AGAM|nr:hypothetical protein SISSUDRAFT_1040666 [Sistotremastrum suecicum HHB10207 ss-3]